MDNFAQRLLSARKMAGLSLQDLADRMDIDITKQALNQYEKGQTTPSSKVIISLSNALGLPVDYFFKKSDVKLENLEFRKKSSLSQKEIEAARFKTMDYLEKYLEIEGLLNVENTFTNPLKKAVVHNEQDIEKHANDLRKAWDLGLDPIPDVIALLEEKRIKVFELEAPDEFSGLSSRTDGIAVIVVNKNVNIVRKRFTALHELAHLVLTFPDAMDDKQKELLCYTFAGAFLFPEEVFKDEFGKKRTSILLNELVLLENYYGISVQAIMRRAHGLQLISDSKFRDYQAWLSKSGNKKKELGAFKGGETPMRFRRLVYKALSEDIITYSKAAAFFGVPQSEFEEELTRVI